MILWTAALALASSAQASPEYRIALDEQRPLTVDFTLHLPLRPEERLQIDPETEAALVRPPECDNAPLRQLAAGDWVKPAGCVRVQWTARLVDHDTTGLDATRPAGAWSARNRMWVLTGLLPWLRTKDQSPARVRGAVRLADGGTLARDWTITPGRGAPLYLALGPGTVQRFAEDGIEILVRGDVPTIVGAVALQQAVAETWHRWRRDILPPGATAVERLDVAWVQPRADIEPGFYASTGSHAILMQYRADPADPNPDAKLRAGILLTGAHEVFHALLGAFGAFGASRPAWVNESWGTFFAWQAARRHLTGDSLALAEELVATPVDHSILGAQRRWDSGDQTTALTFYGKGARFWAAIEAVLDGPGNDSGKLAALIQRTGGLRGLDWLDASAVAAELDLHSGGRTGAIVRCYLENQACP